MLADHRRPSPLSSVLEKFVVWLQGYGETSSDHQSFFAGRFGGAAKTLYYRRRAAGLGAVAPLVACEALLPSARQFFHYPQRFPIADAHYAMGFATLFEITGRSEYFERAEHFLEELERSRCRVREYCWGYPFDWVTRNGTIKAGTPLITTTPYVYEAFLQMWMLDGRDHWNDVLQSIVRHACFDIRDFQASPRASSCSYTPYDKGGVVNAAAYRAFLLTSASQVFGEEKYWTIAERNLNFVLESQNADGSWYYAMDGVREFVDHFHTCFVMKALAKIHTLTRHEDCLRALTRGVRYYLTNLFDQDGLPRPFAKAPRVTVYKRELYDCAECINLGTLLSDRFPECRAVVDRVVDDIISNWTKPDGSFRSRRLFWGWDNVPMHRWAQSQMFRALAIHFRDHQERRVAAGTVASEINPAF